MKLTELDSKPPINMFDCLQRLKDAIVQYWEVQNKITEIRPDIARVIRYIKNHLELDLSLEVLAHEVQLNPSYLGRIFKKDMGLSIIDHIMEQRIGQAKRYMADGTYRNYELAEKVGFKSYSYFSTMFKKVTGKTANEYKNSMNHLL